MSQVGVCIDWLRYTAHWGFRSLPSSPSAMSGARIGRTVFPVATEWKEAKARKGYTAAMEAVNFNSVTIMWSPDRPDMGVSIDVPGSALAKLDAFLLLDHITDNAFSATRIDLAVDVREAWSADALSKQIEAGEHVTQSRKHRRIVSDSGWTIYVGSRASQRMLRIYDKAAQTKQGGSWTRAELECKGDYARGITYYIQQNGLGSIPDIIKDFCDFPNYSPWRAAMTSPTLFAGVPKLEKTTDTQAWLLNVVAPSLVNQLKADPAFDAKWAARMAALLGGVGGSDYDIFDGKGDFDLY